MPVSKKRFIANLEDAGIMTEQQVKQRLADLPKEQQPIDGKTLANVLVADGVITSYQAERLKNPRTCAMATIKFRASLDKGAWVQSTKHVISR